MTVHGEREAIIDEYIHEAIRLTGCSSIASLEYGLADGKKKIEQLNVTMTTTFIVLIICVITWLALPSFFMGWMKFKTSEKKFNKAYKYVKDAIENDPELINSYFQ